jgi:hypothetical protein
MEKDQRLKYRPLKADLHIHTAEDPLDRVPYTAQELIVKAAAEGLPFQMGSFLGRFLSWKLRRKKPQTINKESESLLEKSL